MLLTKEEFQNLYKFADLSAVYRLIKQKKIRLNDSGLIDTTDKLNIPYIKGRQERIKKQSVKDTESVAKQIRQKKERKSADELALKIDLMNAQLEEKNQKSKLMQIKIAKEQSNVIETDVLNRCIQAIFADMIKNLTELPNIYASDVIKYVQTEEQPKEIIVEFLTQKITNALKQGLSAAKTATKKYYEEDFREGGVER